MEKRKSAYRVDTQPLNPRYVTPGDALDFWEALAPKEYVTPEAAYRFITETGGPTGAAEARQNMLARRGLDKENHSSSAARECMIQRQKNHSSSKSHKR